MSFWRCLRQRTLILEPGHEIADRDELAVFLPPHKLGGMTSELFGCQTGLQYGSKRLLEEHTRFGIGLARLPLTLHGCLLKFGVPGRGRPGNLVASFSIAVRWRFVREQDRWRKFISVFASRRNCGRNWSIRGFKFTTPGIEQDRHGKILDRWLILLERSKDIGGQVVRDRHRNLYGGAQAPASGLGTGTGRSAGGAGGAGTGTGGGTGGGGGGGA